MSSAVAELTLLVLTEDSADDAHAVLVALLKRSFALMVPGCAAWRIPYEPATAEARAGMRGNRWKSTAPDDEIHIRRLRRAIATKLGEEGPLGFVLFHFDGDRRWSDRATCENAEKFEARIAVPVRRLLEGQLPDRAEEAMVRLLPLTPFWCIEAWLYQNLREARQIWIEQGRPDSLDALLSAWEADRTALEELPTPKEACDDLRSKHNLRLATHGWPADVVFHLDRSYTAAVLRLLASDALVAALEAGRDTPTWSA